MDKIEKAFLVILISIIIGTIIALINIIINRNKDSVYIYQNGTKTEIAFKDYSIENYEVITIDDNKTDIIVHMNKEGN